MNIAQIFMFLATESGYNQIFTQIKFMWKISGRRFSEMKLEQTKFDEIT